MSTDKTISPADDPTKNKSDLELTHTEKPDAKSTTEPPRVDETEVPDEELEKATGGISRPTMIACTLNCGLPLVEA
jgi:hypothetical protein